MTLPEALEYFYNFFSFPHGLEGACQNRSLRFGFRCHLNLISMVTHHIFAQPCIGTQFPCLPCVDGVITTYGDHQHVQIPQLLQLILAQIASKVTQMCDTKRSSLQDADDVIPPQRAILIIMVSMDFLHLKWRIRLCGHQCNPCHTIVISMVVAAQHLICFFPQILQTWHFSIFIWIQDDRISLRFHFEAGMPQSGDRQLHFHSKLLLPILIYLPIL